MSIRRKIGGLFFRWRDLLPVPLVGCLLAVARPCLTTWILGLPFILAGEALRIWSLCFIGPTTRTREICADILVIEGPYALCRHPLYLANLLKIVGILLVAGNLRLALGVLALYAAEFFCMIPYEDGFLAEKFAEVHKQYLNTVPALIPNQFSSAFSATPKFSFFQAIKSETRTFASTGAILLMCFVSPLLRSDG